MRDCIQLSKSVLAYKTQLLTRVVSAESFTKAIFEDEMNYTMGFKNIEITLHQEGHFTTGTLIILTNELDETIYIITSDLIGTFVSDVIE